MTAELVDRNSGTCAAAQPCESTPYAKGLCSRHYRRHLRARNRLATVGVTRETRKEFVQEFIDNDTVRGPGDVPMFVRASATRSNGEWAVIVRYPQMDDTRNCASMNTDYFFNVDHGPIRPDVVLACQACPFRRGCAEWGLAAEQYGVFGGLSPDDRVRIRSIRNQRVLNPAHASLISEEFADWSWDKRLDMQATRPHKTQDDDWKETWAPGNYMRRRSAELQAARAAGMVEN